MALYSFLPHMDPHSALTHEHKGQIWIGYVFIVDSHARAVSFHLQLVNVCSNPDEAGGSFSQGRACLGFLPD